MSVPDHAVDRTPALLSPKQPLSLKRRDWYPYYAGFTEDFAHAVLDTHLRHATRVLDPWSGSGTTTATCMKRNTPSHGVDINPALTVVARGRLAPMSSVAEVSSRLTEIVQTARSISPDARPDDLLHLWIQPRAVRRIRALQRAIHRLILPSRPNLGRQSGVLSLDHLSADICFFYTTLFSAVRRLLSPFRTSNPMWLKPPKSFRTRIAPSWSTITFSLHRAADFFADRLWRDPSLPLSLNYPLTTGTATSLPFRDHLFDGVLTSPPYATRLDYVQGTLPELAILGADRDTVSNLRRQTTGSPVVTHVSTAPIGRLLSDCGANALSLISDHPSKGSRSYYSPWMRNYLMHLQAGLLEIARTTTPSGTICIVVQDSYYKEHRIDLQRIVIQILASLGRRITDRHDYRARNPRSHATHAKGTTGSAHRRPHTESLLVFGASN